MKKFIIAAALFPTLLFGQSNADSLKFEIIKESINFLSTDTSISKTKGKLADCPHLDYDCLLEFCEKEKINGADIKLTKWNKESPKNFEDLDKFQKSIIGELTKKKSYRKKLSMYNNYTAKLSKLAKSFKVKLDDKKVQLDDKKDKLDDKKDKKVIVKNIPVVTTITTNNDVSNLPLYALLVGIIALVLSAYALFIGAFKLSSKVKSGLSRIDTDIRDLNYKLAKIQSNELTKSLEDKIKIIESRLQQLENPPRRSELSVTENRAASPTINPIASFHTVFAKLPDLGNGFSQAILLQGQNGEQIYEIEIKGDKANFRISDNANAQKYALSDFNYYLSNACDFINQPVKNSRINTTEIGILSKSSGNWIIQRKAKIEFM